MIVTLDDGRWCRMIDVVRRYRAPLSDPSGGAGPQGAARLAMSGLAVGILVAIAVTVAALFGVLIGAVVASDAYGKGLLREKIDGACPACGSHEVIEFGRSPADAIATKSEAS